MFDQTKEARWSTSGGPGGEEEEEERSEPIHQ